MADKPAEYYPPMGFSFRVSVTGLQSAAFESQFQSVSGLSVDIELEEFAEGGENRFKHKFPVKTKFPNLVLKRGFLVDSSLIRWCKDAVENFNFSRKDITVELLTVDGTSQKSLMTWNIVGAIPVKWNVDEFNAQESKLAVETIELAYNYFTVK